MDMQSVLFGLLRVAVCGSAADERLRAACTSEMLEEIYTLANHHDLTHLVGQAVSKLGLSDSVALNKCKQAAMLAFVRYMRQNHVYEQTCAALETAQIPFIPLKGSVLRNYYPEPWMRTSCDIDILVHPEDLAKAKAVLAESLSYREMGRTEHDVTMMCPNGEHIELHFDLVEKGRANTANKVLRHVWKNVTLSKNHNYQYEMKDDFFYFYHIAHMAKHIEIGGCGVRTFLDLWIMNHKMEPDWQARCALLKRGDLTTFSDSACRLSEQWFSGKEAGELSQQFAQFILDGGVYGSLRNGVIVQQKKKGSKYRYVLSRVFLPYDAIKVYYPVLEKYKCLTPLFQIVRWFRVIFSGNAKRAAAELQISFAMSKEDKISAGSLLDYIGLH